MIKRVLTALALGGMLAALVPPLHQVADAQPCPPSQPPGRPPGQPQSGDSGRPESYGPGECQLLLSNSVGSEGSGFTVSGSGFSPGSQVTVTFESDPVVLAVVTADGSGNFVAGVAVPAGAEPGSHTVRASGTGADGEPHALAAAFTVVGESAGGPDAVEGPSSDEASSTGDSASSAADPADATAMGAANDGGDEGAASSGESSDDGDAVAASPANTTGTSSGAFSTLAGVGLGIAAVTVISLLVALRRRQHAAT